MTIKTIIKDIENVYNNTILFQSFTVAPSYEYQRSPDLLYPAMFVELPQSDVQINTEINDLSLVITFSDRSFEGMENDLEISSRIHMFANIFMKICINEYNLEFTDLNFLMFTEEGEDRVYSVRCEFKISHSIGVCDDYSTYVKPTC